MKYELTRLNRIVELDDELATKYCEYDEIRENPFLIVLTSKYGHAPTCDEISDEELSIICNEVLLSELKALALLPQALSFVDTLMEATDEIRLLELSLKDEE